MNLNSEILSLFVLPFANVLLLTVALLAIVRMQWLLRSKSIVTDPAAGEFMATEIAAIGGNVRQLSAQLSETQDKLLALSHIERLLSEPVSPGMPMERAAVLARNGASIDELARSCGLNIGEARLMRRMHGRNGAESQAA